MFSFFLFSKRIFSNLSSSLILKRPLYQLGRTMIILCLSLSTCHLFRNGETGESQRHSLPSSFPGETEEGSNPQLERCKEFTQNEISEQELYQMSQLAFFHLIKQYGAPLVDKPAGINALNQDLFKMVVNLASRSQRPAFLSTDERPLYRITILPSSEINAFSLVGGDIIVTWGLLEHQYRTGNENQINHILGHEIWHIIHGDSAAPLKATKFEVCSEVFKPNPLPEFKELRQGFEAALDVSCKGVINLDHTDPKLVKKLTERYVEKLICGSYDKDLEFKADEEGLRLAILAGYRPDYQNLFSQLKPVHGFSNHPSSEARVKNLDAFFQSLQPTPTTFGYPDWPFSTYTLRPVSKEFSILETEKPISLNSPWEKLCMAKK